MDMVFDRFDRDPIAAASLGALFSAWKVLGFTVFITTVTTIIITVELISGQVHRAKLRGKEVVVKVQRPGLKALFDIDLKNLRVRNLVIASSLITSNKSNWNFYFPTQCKIDM